MPTYILYQTVRDAEGEEVESFRWDCTGLRDALTDLGKTRTAHCGGVEYIGARHQAWNDTCIITVQNAPEYRTDHAEERVLAIVGIKHGTARRLARLINAQWSA